MDWKYKHFNHVAVFNAPPERVREAARAVMAESFQTIEDTGDGFVAHGQSGWHAASAAFHLTPAANGTQVAIELQVERANRLGYTLFDVGDFYTGQIDKWLARIARGLGGAPEQILVSTTSSRWRLRQGCLRGCLVYLVVGACLIAFALPLDHALFPQLSGSDLGPFEALGSLAGLLVGIAAFVYVAYPESSPSKAIRARLGRTQDRQGQ